MRRETPLIRSLTPMRAPTNPVIPSLREEPEQLKKEQLRQTTTTSSQAMELLIRIAVTSQEAAGVAVVALASITKRAQLRRDTFRRVDLIIAESIKNTRTTREVLDISKRSPITIPIPSLTITPHQRSNIMRMKKKKRPLTLKRAMLSHQSSLLLSKAKESRLSTSFQWL
jgi:hypothetical protein